MNTSNRVFFTNYTFLVMLTSNSFLIFLLPLNIVCHLEKSLLVSAKETICDAMHWLSVKTSWRKVSSKIPFYFQMLARCLNRGGGVGGGEEGHYFTSDSISSMYFSLPSLLAPRIETFHGEVRKNLFDFRFDHPRTPLNS